MMEMDSKFVGLQTCPYKTKVTLRQAMNYAAAVNDANPRYLDDERSGGIIAPPMIVAALTWPISLNIGDYLEDKSFPTQCTQQQVHHSESIRWYAPIMPGQSLEIRGELAALLAHPAGCEMIMRYDAYEDEQLVFTEYSGALLRGVQLVGEEKGREQVPEILKAPGFEEPVWVEQIDIDPLAAHVYDGCADISFPIHTSPAFAHKVGLPAILLQGTATLAHAVKTITNREREGDSNSLRELDCTFTGMVFPGERIDVRLIRREQVEGNGDICYFDVLNQAGKRAISRGRMMFNPPETK